MSASPTADECKPLHLGRRLNRPSCGGVPRRLRKEAAYHFIDHDAHLRADMPRLGPNGVDRKALCPSIRQHAFQPAIAQVIGDQPSRKKRETVSGESGIHNGVAMYSDPRSSVLRREIIGGSDPQSVRLESAFCPDYVRLSPLPD